LVSHDEERADPISASPALSVSSTPEMKQIMKMGLISFILQAAGHSYTYIREHFIYY
jgi:hypothetical protein